MRDEATRSAHDHRSRARRRWSGDGLLSLVVATMLTVTGLVLLGSGAPALWTDQQQRDRDGFVTSEERLLETPTSALVVTPLDVALDRPVDDFLVQRALGEVRVQVRETSGAPLFVGLGPADAVEAYLRDVPVDRLREISFGRPADLDRRAGTRRPQPPAQQDLWLESAQGTGPLHLDVTVGDGHWALVVMQPDGSAGVRAELSLGATLPALTWIASGVVVLGGLFLVGGVALLVALARPRSRPPTAPPGDRPLVPRPRGQAGASPASRSVSAADAR